MSLKNHSESDPTFTSELTSEIDSSNLNQAKSSEGQDCLLKNSQRKLIFFTKIGILSFINFGFYSLVALFLVHLQQMARQYYWIYNIESMFYINLLMIITLKCIISFISSNLKKIGIILYALDIFLSFRNLLGLYFFFGNYLQNMYIYDGHYVILFCYILFANSIAYIFSTLYRKKDQQYNYLLGFILMEISTFVTISFFRSSYSIMTMRLSKYIFVFMFFSVVNFYIALDTFLMSNIRDTKYQESDYIFGYYALWTDWFSFFWVDLYKYNYRKKLENDKKKKKEDVQSEDEYEDYPVDKLSQSFSEGVDREP